MYVLFDGTANRPLGRQLYAEEWPSQPAPRLHSSPRPKIQVFHRPESLRMRILTALEAESLSCPDLALQLDVDVEAVRAAIHKLRHENRVCVVGTQLVTPAQKYDRATERIYAPIGRES